MEDRYPWLRGNNRRSNDDDEMEELYASGRAQYVYDPRTGRTTMRRIVSRTFQPIVLPNRNDKTRG